jgi:putative transposase
MSRIARAVVPGVPHHVIQRGNRRMDVFFTPGDRENYLGLLREFGERYGVKFWGYCLMSNHVHLIAVPSSAESLALAIGWAHHRYTRQVNFREGWRGFLWQGRFYSCPCDLAHAERALRYLELNPVRAGLVQTAEEWRWSSAAGHVSGKPDGLTVPVPFIDDGAAWGELLRRGTPVEELQSLRTNTRTGRPLGSPRFVERAERLLSRTLRPARRGPKVRQQVPKPAAGRK